MLVRRCPSGGQESVAPTAASTLRLPLCADQRTSLRGRRRSACGRELLLQLPRGAALKPGEQLVNADGSVTAVVEAASEAVMDVSGVDPLALLQAAYHLGNRHVALELHADHLVLLEDSVLMTLLRQRGLQVLQRQGPFHPEAGAYADLSPGDQHHHHP